MSVEVLCIQPRAPGGGKRVTMSVSSTTRGGGNLPLRKKRRVEETTGPQRSVCTTTRRRHGRRTPHVIRIGTVYAADRLSLRPAVRCVVMTGWMTMLFFFFFLAWRERLGWKGEGRAPKHFLSTTYSTC